MSRDYEHGSGSVIDREIGMGTLYAEAMTLARTMKETVLKGVSIIDAMKALMRCEVRVREEHITEAHARIGSVDEIDSVAKRLLEDIAADEKVHAKDLKFAVESDSLRGRY